MKKQTKKRLFKLLGIGACSFVLGLSACSSNYYYGDHSEETKQQEYVEKHTRKNIVYDVNTYTITYDFSDNVASTWQNIYDVLTSNGYTSSSNNLPVDGYAYSLDNTRITHFNFLYAFNQSTTPSLNTDQGLEYYFAENPYWGFRGTSYSDVKLVITSETYYNLFEPRDNMPQVLTDFMGLLVGGIQSLAVGIAQGVASMASALFLRVDNGVVTGLSTFGGIIAIFAGIALAVGITTRVYLWITRLGKD